MCFGSPAGFNHAVDGREHAYYCKRNATGQYDRFRNIPHVDQYWEQTAGWEEFISNSEVSIHSLLKWFTGHQDGTKRFPGMGNLVGWLLASDYAYARLVNTPTPFDVGKIIFAISAGSKKGLSLLGFDTQDENACGAAMEAVWAAVHKQLILLERTEVELDVITVEHALCKFARLHNIFVKVSSIPPIIHIKSTALISLIPNKGDLILPRSHMIAKMRSFLKTLTLFLDSHPQK